MLHTSMSPNRNKTLGMTQGSNVCARSPDSSLVWHSLKPGVIGAVMPLTPVIAQSFLCRNRSNRPLTDSYVQSYTERIRRGEWVLEWTPIIFDENDYLIQGQHRCSAVIRAGIPIEVWVIKGPPSTIFTVLDTGKMRSGSDTLAISGFDNYTVLAAAARVLSNLAAGTQSFSGKFSNDQLLTVLKNNPLLPDSIPFARQCKAVISMGLGVALHFLFKQQDGPAADLFFSSLGSGDNLSRDDPVLTLRNKLMTQGKHKMPQPMVAALTIKAWNATRRGHRVQILKWLDEESMPEII